MRRIFYPNNLVVIGVSERPENLARNIIGNLHSFGYKGTVFAVGRKAGMVHGIPIATSLDEVPDGLDLAVVLTPAASVPDLMEECGRKAILQVVIESGGFSEFSHEGRGLEQKLLEIARKWNIRFVGPNCISVVNLETGLCLPFTPMSPATARLGPASVVSQSGGVSITYVDRLCTAGVGVNKGISIGNKTDLNEADYLSYLLQDDSTEIVCMYLESISNGRELMGLARSSKKPIIIHKANRGQASQNVALSHTAALADDDRIVTAALRQSGIIRSESFRDSVAIAQGLALPPVRGNNLVVISRSGGHAVIAADTAERYGFRLPPLPDEFTRRVRSLFSADVIALTNPLDLGTIFDFELYAQIVEQCLHALSPDAILLVNAYSLDEAEGAHRLARRVDKIARDSDRPIAFCVYSQGDETRATQMLTKLPVFAEIEDAMRGLAASRDWNDLQSRLPLAADNVVHVRNETAEKLVKSGQLTAEKALYLCEAYGIPIAPFKVANEPESAVQAAHQLGYPVALKVLAAQLTHKSDGGGVALGLADASEVKREAERMKARFAYSSKLMVQRMAKGGLEVILGGRRDRSFGPVVMFGLGGIYVEVFGDVAIRVAPITRADAEEMVGEIRGRQLIDGVRGQLSLDREALIQALLSLSRMLVENPSLAELDINPLLVLERGVLALDARALLKEEGTT
jgi:acyl-CoA synthetase (NDP forming)